MGVKHKYPKVTITWGDHWATHTNAAVDPEEIPGMLKPVLRETTGYLVGKNKECLAIAGTIESDGSVCEVTILMRNAIKKEEKL